MNDFDVVIVGAGIAGASLAAEISADKSVLLLEAESVAGYHSTGRSAAFWTETYGGPAIQPLTSASGPFLLSPPSTFSETSLLTPRGALHLGHDSDEVVAEAMLVDFARSRVALDRLNSSELATRVTGLREGWSTALWEPDCCDIDVGGLHNGYLKAARGAGAQILCNAPLTQTHFFNGRWAISAGGNSFTTKTLVNAAGAWADDVAVRSGVMPIGITPFRRTIMQLVVEPGASADLPLVVGLDGSFYFKPEAGGRVWLSPHDEIATEPCDAAPEELDIAMAIDRFQQVVDWEVIRLERKWAGLRSFARDRLPVIGHDRDIPEFFWLAGQGGFGIQTAPAVAAMAGALLMNRKHEVPNANADDYAPDRFR
ncbi:MAG: FAD-dependent oxidoreductase [Sphingorhabdus sp.]